MTAGKRAHDNKKRSLIPSVDQRPFAFAGQSGMPESVHMRHTDFIRLPPPAAAFAGTFLLLRRDRQHGGFPSHGNPKQRPGSRGKKAFRSSSDRPAGTGSLKLAHTAEYARLIG